MELHGAIREELLAEAFDRLDSDDSGYISADNLSEILGKDFPRAEIDAIIAEATGGKHNKISYAEFLKLWEVKKEAEREQMIQELTEVDEDNNSVSSLDYLSEGGTTEARAMFIGNKISASAKSAKAESKNSDREGSRHVGFEEGVEYIPHQEAVV